MSNFQFPENLRDLASVEYQFDSQSEEDLQFENESLPKRGFKQSLRLLRDLAEPEDWSGTENPHRYLPILSSYLNFTYKRLVAEGKILISSDGSFAAFNTGLITPLAEEIFAVYGPNKRDNRPFAFRRWTTPSDGILHNQFSQLPEMAQYFSSMSDLVFDFSNEIHPNYRHILNDHPERYPEEFKALPEPIRLSLLKGAIDRAIIRARRNYKTLVPQMYVTDSDSRIQFLMPLDLMARGKTDVALVVNPQASGAATANTALTLGMAYNNARLICRPSSEWLPPIAPPDEESAE